MTQQDLDRKEILENIDEIRWNLRQSLDKGSRYALLLDELDDAKAKFWTLEKARDTKK